MLALTSITLTTNATVSGRALARNGAVTMDTNNMTVCALVAAGSIPTLSTWALAVLAGLLALAGYLKATAAK